MLRDPGLGVLCPQRTVSQALRHHRVPSTRGQEPCQALETYMRDISKPTSLSLSQEAGGLPSGHGNRVPQAPPTHEKRTDSRLSWERPKGALSPSSAFCRPGPVLGPQGPNPCFPRARKGCLVVLRFFRYIFCTLWKECVCDRGPARAWGRGGRCQTFPGGGWCIHLSPL